MGFGGSSRETVIRAICVYLVYGYSDLARILFGMGVRDGLFSETERQAIQEVLSKFEKRATIPNFRGRGRVRRCLQKILKLFDVNGWAESDQSIGNA